MMKTKIFFFGTPEIAVPSLKILAALPEIEIVGVGVFPDKPVGRKKVLTPCPVKVAAQELELNIVELKNKKALVKCFEDYEINLGIVIAFGMIFPQEILNKPRLGIINVHFSLLPDYRGASPVQSAILEGKKTTGITWQRMVKALDAGDVLWQTEHDIENQTTLEVWNDFAEFTAEEFPAFLEHYTQDRLAPQVQDETKATFCGKFTKADGEIFPETETAQTIYQKFLAFEPWPGIFLNTSSGRLKIQDAQRDSSEDTACLKCAKNSLLHISKAQVEGKKPAPILEILNGHPNILEK